MGVCNPFGSNASQCSLMMSRIGVRNSSGQSLHCVISLSCSPCLIGSNVMTSSRGGNSFLFLYALLPKSLCRISRPSLSSGMFSGSLYTFVTFGLYGRCSTHPYDVRTVCPRYRTMKRKMGRVELNMTLAMDPQADPIPSEATMELRVLVRYLP